MQSQSISDELQTFKSIKELNWSWIFYNRKNVWTQFDCLVCMALESKYQQHLKGEKVKLVLKIGTIDFD